MKGLFVNHLKSNCSIYESGLMIYNALSSSTEYKLDYLEIPRFEADKYPYTGYDFYVFNWHHNTLPIRKETLDKVKGLKIGIVLEVGAKEYKPFMPQDLFDAYMILDPTKEKTGKFYPFPRPLESVESLKPLLSDIPVIGTFGFLVPGKNFLEVLENCNNLGTDCILRINLPMATYTGIPFSVIKSFSDELQEQRGRNVDLRITHDYMEKPDLIRWLSEHTLNVFPYYRNMPGLSAVTDQAIVANRGIAITSCNTFRHLHKYIGYYPKETYMQLSTSTLPGIKQMQQDWSRKNFVIRFVELLTENNGNS